MTKRVAVSLALVLAFLLGIPVGSASAAPGDEYSESNKPGIQTLSSCLQTGRSLSALFLLDQSGSLGSTDPNGVRYEGLAAALESLSSLTTGEDPAAVDVAVASFDHNYYGTDEVVEWTGLGGEKNAEVIERIVDEARNQTRPGGGTAFDAALQGVQQDIADRGSRGNCRVVFWFTDGEWDGLDSDPTAWNDMCSPGGLADQLRQAGVTLVGLRLLNQPDPDRLPTMPAITLGSAEQQCGTVPIPEGSSPGVQLSVNDANDIAELFEGIEQVINGCVPTETLGGTIDPGVGGMWVTIPSTETISTVRLDGPGVSIAAAAQGQTEQDGYLVESIVRPRGVSMKVTFPVGRGAGDWRVTPDKPVPPQDVTYCVFTDLRLVEDAASFATVAAGVPSAVTVSVVHADGSPADLSVFRAVSPGATVTSAGGDIPQTVATVADAPAGKLKVDFTPAVNDSRVDLAMKVGITTTSGLEMLPLAGQWGVPVKLSALYPLVTPIDALRLTEAVKKAPATGTLTLTGSSLGPTEVCFAPLADIQQPEEEQSAVVDFPQGCIPLATGEARTINVSVTPAEPAEGAASAVLPLELRPFNDGSNPAASAAELPVEWRYRDPLNVRVLVWVIILLSLISVALPLLAMLVANYLASRFDVDRLKVAKVPVVVTSAALTRRDSLADVYGLDADTLVDPNEFQLLVPERARRSHAPGMWKRSVARQFFVDTGVGRLDFRGVAPRWPLRYPKFVIQAPKGTRLLSSSGPAPLGDGSRGQASGGLGLLVVLHVSDAELANKASQAVLVILTRDSNIDYSSLDKRVKSAMPWPAVMEELRGASEGARGSSGPPQATDDGLPSIPEPRSPSDDYDENYNLPEPPS